MSSFQYALNASTLFPFKLDIKQQIEIAARAGYEGLEIWIKDIDTYLSNGGSLPDLRKYIEESKIKIVNAIAFFAWADEDENIRAQGFAQAEKEMRMLAEIGCSSVAAPPFGNVANVSLDNIAHYFSQLVLLGRSLGVEPYLEFWGRAKKLSTLSEIVYVALQSRVHEAKFLLDPFHMYTGGSAIEGLEYIQAKNIGIVHINDYPADPARDIIADADRVFPGDGVAPITTLATLLSQAGYRGFLSLELFLQDVEGYSALDFAKLGLAKSKNAFTI